MKEALLYKKLAENKVSYFLCSHHRLISEGKFEICNVGENKNGVLHTYSELVAPNIDPVEKKPLQYHSLLIERLGYSIKEYRIKEDRFLHCRGPIDGVGL